MSNRRHITRLFAALALVGATAGLAQAQTAPFPAKPIRWVVPYPAGGGSDFLARTIGQQLSTHKWASPSWWTTSPAATPPWPRRT